MWQQRTSDRRHRIKESDIQNKARNDSGLATKIAKDVKRLLREAILSGRLRAVYGGKRSSSLLRLDNLHFDIAVQILTRRIMAGESPADLLFFRHLGIDLARFPVDLLCVDPSRCVS